MHDEYSERDPPLSTVRPFIVPTGRCWGQGRGVGSEGGTQAPLHKDVAVIGPSDCAQKSTTTAHSRRPERVGACTYTSACRDAHT